MVSTLDVAPMLSIISYNIHKGIRFTVGGDALETIAEQLRGQRADVIMLQEAGEHGRQASQLAQALGYTLVYAQTARHGHGNAILSKQPIAVQGKLDLTLHRLEQRGLLHCRGEWQGRTVHLCTTHLNLREHHRHRQIDKIIAYIHRHIPKDEAVVLAGDFNDWRQRLCRPLAQRVALIDAHRQCFGAPAKTFPALAPMLALDRIYSRHLQPLSATVANTSPWQASDHAPIQAHFSSLQ